MGLTESCCGGPRSVASDRYRKNRSRGANEEKSSESIENKIQKEVKTVNTAKDRTKTTKDPTGKIKRNEDPKRRLTPPPGLSVKSKESYKPESISSPTLDSPIAHPPSRAMPFGTKERGNSEKQQQQQQKQQQREDIKDPIMILFRNIKEAQEGKRSNLLSAHEVIQELKSGNIKSISMDYMIPIHKTSRERFTKKSSMQFCMKDFATFGRYLMYDQTFSENLKEFCKLMTSKLSTMKSEDLFQNEEKMVHLFESVTLFAIAGAVHLRMLKDMKSKKKSQMKLNETWMMSRKCFKKKDRRNAFLQCFPALIGLLRTKTFNGKLCARAVDEIVVFEGYHDFVRFRNVSDITEYVKHTSKSKSEEDETNDLVGELLTESESGLPRESFVHGQFNNAESKHCWLSTSFQSLWHSTVFHSAFEHIVVRSIDADGSSNKLEHDSVTRGLMETWKMYRNVNAGTTVSPSSMASVWGSKFGDPVDCLNGIASRKTKKNEPIQLSRLGRVLFGKSLKKGHGVVCTYVPKMAMMKLRAQSVWMSLHKAYRSRPLLMLQIPTTVGQTNLLDFFESFAPVYDQNGCETQSHIGDAGHHLVSIICYLEKSMHYVCFCRRKEVPSRWRLYNDIPDTLYESTKHCKDLMNTDGGSIDLVKKTLQVYDLIPTVFVFESRDLYSKSLKGFAAALKKGDVDNSDEKNCTVS